MPKRGKAIPKSRAGAARKFDVAGELSPPDASRRVFIGALVASLVFHAIFLSLHFSLPDRLARVAQNTLEVVLVNAKSAKKPVKAQAKAQANLDGGGNTDEDRRAKTPLPSSRKAQPGDSLVEAQRRVQALEAQQQKLLTRAKGSRTIQAEARPSEAQPEQDNVRGIDLAQSAMAIARMEAQIERQVEEYNKRPRKKEFSPRTAEAVEAMYVEGWRQKVERVGNLNYPEAAKGRLYGSLVLYVEIRADGGIERVEVARSSGHKVLDDAAMRIVRLAAPYGAFPPEMKKNMDILMLARTWVFTKANELQSQ